MTLQLAIVMITYVQCRPWKDPISMMLAGKHIEWTYRQAKNKNLGLLSAYCG